MPGNPAALRNGATMAIIKLSDGTEVLVDDIDYEWAVQWKWYAKPSKSRHIIYACRTLTLRVCGKRKDICLFLHVEIMKRIKKPPTRRHTISDHRFGNTLDCRRAMLRWATPKMNRKNINGAHPYSRHELKVGTDALRP